MNITIEDLEFDIALDQEAMKSLTGGKHYIGSKIHSGISAVTYGSWEAWQRKSFWSNKYGNSFRNRNITRCKYF